MRTPIIAGNWKMYKSLPQAVDFVNEIKDRLVEFSQAERVVCPPFVALPAVAAALDDSDIAVGAQDAHWEDEGAYTGQVAAGMLAGLVSYVIVGHSETRQYQGVTDEMVNWKAKAVLRHGLRVIIAVGESLEVNERGETQIFVARQIRTAFDGIEPANLDRIVIAYEPIWAIGTGKSATAEDANRTIGSIRSVVEELYGPGHAEEMRIQYGGSVKPDNMADFMRQPHIDGSLVGGASLKADSFVALVQLAIEAKGLA